MIYLYFTAFFAFPSGCLRYWIYFSDNPCGIMHYVYTHNAQSLSLQFAFIWNKDPIKQGVGDAGKYR